MKVQPKVMLTSPYLRAVQTAEIVCAALEFPLEKLRRTDALKPDSIPPALYEDLAKLKADEVMCFGHAPHMDEAIAHAVRAPGTFTELKKAGVACLDLESFTPTKAKLVSLYPAKTLRELGD